MKFRKCTNTGNSDRSGYAEFRPSGLQPPLDRDAFLTELKEACPNAGYIKLFPKQEVPGHVLEECCLPEPIFNYSDNVDLTSSACQTEFDKYVQNLINKSSSTDSIAELTKGQSANDVWMKARTGRITASRFATVCRRKENVDPNSLIKSVMGYYSDKTSDGMEWGINHENTAKKEYVREMKNKGHRTISVEESGLCVMPDYPYIGASPDGLVSCSCGDCKDSEGLLEIKCPFKHRNFSPKHAALNRDFCCDLNNDSLTLKKSHPYYFQVQGQMAVTGRNWCDFVIWTRKGISIERIPFDISLWKDILPKLSMFFRDCIVPEIFSRRLQRKM